MKKLMKKSVALLVGTMALAGVAGLAQAAAVPEVRFAVQDNATVPNDKMVVTDQGFIGVGTNTPATAIQINGNTNESSKIDLKFTGASTSAAGGLILRKNNLSTTNNGLPLLGDRIGYILFGSIGSDSGEKNAAGFASFAESNWTNTSFPAYFTIETTPLAPNSARIERLRVNGSGDIGIGTKAPKARLEVAGGVRVYPVSAATANTESPTMLSKPACNANTRGTIWFTPSETGDVIEVCVKTAGNYAFKAVTLTP